MFLNKPGHEVTLLDLISHAAATVTRIMNLGTLLLKGVKYKK